MVGTMLNVENLYFHDEQNINDKENATNEERKSLT